MKESIPQLLSVSGMGSRNNEVLTRIEEILSERHTQLSIVCIPNQLGHLEEIIPRELRPYTMSRLHFAWAYLEGELNIIASLLRDERICLAGGLGFDLWRFLHGAEDYDDEQEAAARAHHQRVKDRVIERFRLPLPQYFIPAPVNGALRYFRGTGQIEPIILGGTTLTLSRHRSWSISAERFSSLHSFHGSASCRAFLFIYVWRHPALATHFVRVLAAGLAPATLGL